MTPTVGVPDILARSRKLTEPALMAAVERLVPNVRHPVAYHLGWVDVEGQPTAWSGGKGIRPALALLSAEAAGADPAIAVAGAVAVELVHTFSLIHDDIIDADAERHHRPAVWSVWGIGPAIMAGNALDALAHQVLLESESPHARMASSALTEATMAMISGQADDIAFERRRTVTVDEYLAMATGKTGALLGAAAAIGPILAGAPPATVTALRDYGIHLGLAFQAVDDLLGIWGDTTRTGKPAGNDLRQRKKSLPVVAALATGGDEADELAALVAVADPGLPPLDARSVERATYLVEACGGEAFTRAQAKSHLDAALRALEQVVLASSAQHELADMAIYAVERDS